LLSERRKSSWPAALALTAALAVAGCTPERDASNFFSPEEVDVLVIDVVLIVGEPLPFLRLSRTLAPDEPYTLANSGENGATVVITDQSGSRTTYADDSGPEGLYTPLGPAPIVQPSTTYDLFVETERGEILTARTTTPSRLQVARWVALNPADGSELYELETYETAGEGVYDAPENQLPYATVLVEAQLDPQDVQGFQLSLFSLDPDSDFVIDPPFFEEEDFAELNREGSSPALAAEDGAIRLPWFAIYFEGRHKYKVFAIDDNWFDLLRSTPEGDGGFTFGGNLGDGFERPIFRVDGGIGLFGSASVDSTGFRVLQAP
jgi:hypothetical protein